MRTLLRLIVVGAAVAACAAGAAAQQARTLFVSEGRGEDAGADGSLEKPYRTLCCALAEASPGQRVFLQPGEYIDGERWPLEVPAGVVIDGRSSTQVSLVGEDDQTLLVVQGGAARLRGVTLRDADVGVQVGPGAALFLHDCRFVELRRGVSIPATEDDPPPIEVEVTDSGFELCRDAILLEAKGRARLRLIDTEFADNVTGLRVDAPGRRRSHEISLRGCRFRDHDEAGVALRLPAMPDEEAAPLRLDDCRFEGNRHGLLMPQPSGDWPIEVTGCDFVSNAETGVRVLGRVGSEETVSRVLDCEFRRNGVGMLLTPGKGRWELGRCRFSSQITTGLRIETGQARESGVELENLLFDHNGDAGVFVRNRGVRLRLAASFLTIADNARGWAQHESGEARTDTVLRSTLLWFNDVDLAGVAADALQACSWSGATAEAGHLPGDPRFTDREAGDYSLGEGSALRGLLERGPERDLFGRPRPVAGVDPGAVQGTR